MQQECREFLERYIHSSTTERKSRAFYQLFKLYSAYEVHRREDIAPAIDEFFDFLSTCDDLPLLKRDTITPLQLATIKTKNLHRYLESPITPAQLGYSNIIRHIAPKGTRTSFLDVGAGLHPKSSLYLVGKLKTVTAIDKEFLLSVESLSGMKIHPIENTFNEDTDISKYDLVGGRFPCSAIQAIVSKCVKEGKPYFIQLCDCKLPQNPDPHKYPVWTWAQVLKPIDPNVRFYGSCAFNVSVSEKKMRRLIDRYIPEGEKSFSSVSTWDNVFRTQSKLPFEEQLEYARIKLLTADRDIVDIDNEKEEEK